jgi:hypothetical protein
MSDMRKLLESVNKFAGEPEQKPGDQVRSKDKATSQGDKHPFLKRLVGEAQKFRHVTELRQEYAVFKEDQQAVNPRDKVTMDVPLLLRVMEYAKEDAKTDMDLHHVAERLIELSASGRTLSMSDYSSLVADNVAEQIPAPPTTPPTSTNAATSGSATANPQAVAQMKAQQLKQVADQKKLVQDQIKQTTDQLAALRKQLADLSNPAMVAMAETNTRIGNKK